MIIRNFSQRCLAVSFLWCALGHSQQAVEIETEVVKKPFMRAIASLFKAINGDQNDDRHSDQEPSYVRAQRNALAQCAGDNSVHARDMRVTLKPVGSVRLMKRFLDTLLETAVLMSGEQPIQEQQQHAYTINIDDERAYMIAIQRSLEEQQQVGTAGLQSALHKTAVTETVFKEDNGAGVGFCHYVSKEAANTSTRLHS